MFAEAGVKAVIIADQDAKTASETADKAKAASKNSSFDTCIIIMDIADELSVKTMIEKAIDKYGRIDYAVNAAGVGSASFNWNSFVDILLSQVGTDTNNPVSAASMDEYDKVNSINARGTLLFVREISKVTKTRSLLYIVVDMEIEV